MTPLALAEGEDRKWCASSPLALPLPTYSPRAWPCCSRVARSMYRSLMHQISVRFKQCSGVDSNCLFFLS